MRTITLMNCKGLNEVDHALNASWSGFEVRAIYNGVCYDLFADTPETPTNAHEKLMNDSKVMEVKVNSIDWRDFNSYPSVTII